MCVDVCGVCSTEPFVRASTPADALCLLKKSNSDFVFIWSSLVDRVCVV